MDKKKAKYEDLAWNKMSTHYKYRSGKQWAVNSLLRLLYEQFMELSMIF